MTEQKTILGNMVVGNHPSAVFVGNMIIQLLVLAIILLIGRLIWNNVLTKVVTIVKPVTSLELLAISVLIKLIFC
jgi:hypothetical protein